MNALNGGTHVYADAVTGVEDQLSLSPQAMGVIGVAGKTHDPYAHEDDAVELSSLDLEG